MRPAERARTGQRGSAAAELTLITPVLIAFALVVVAFGRLAAAQLQVSDAAHQAARAASLARDPATAAGDARRTAQSALAARRVTCRTPNISVDVGSFQPGGRVQVTVHCTVALGDLMLLRLPGSRGVSASFTSPIDTFRGKSLGFSDRDGAGGDPR